MTPCWICKLLIWPWHWSTLVHVPELRRCMYAHTKCAAEAVLKETANG